MAAERHFMDWDRPCLERAAEWLWGRYVSAQDGEADFRAVAAVVSTRRAGRRLEELLAAEAERCAVRLVPPRVVTVGGLADLLVDRGRPVAGEMARQAAWAAALREMGQSALERIVPRPPEPGDGLGWAILAEQLDRLHGELAAGGLGFADVMREGRHLPDFADGGRWEALAAAQSRYLEQLDAMGLADPQQSLWAALDEGRVEGRHDLVLVGVVDLSVMQRRMIEAVAGRVAVLIHAPAERMDWFDECGCLVVDQWCQAGVNLDDGQVEVVNRPADQAAAVACAIAELDGRYTAEQVVIGVCDPRVAVHIEQQLTGCNLPSCNTAGMPLRQTAPVRLLTAAADWLDRQRFADFATLLRHPDVEWRLLDQREDGESETRGAVEDWLTLLDRYYNDHLQAKLTGRWLCEDGRRSRLKRVYDAVGELMGELMGEARPMNRWAEPIAELLVRVYGGSPLDRREPTHRVLLEACDRLHEALDEMYELNGSAAMAMTAAEALRLLVRHVNSSRPILPEPTEAAVEMVGLSDLLLDDAAAMVVTGFNEGFLPAGGGSDLFLPDSLRCRLGVGHNDRRYARDVYTLSAILASRPHVKLIAGRHTADGDPLSPSRLLFACDDRTTTRRVMKFFGPNRSQPAAAIGFGHLRPGREKGSDFPIPQPPGPLAEPITALPVTAFRDYLACPYRFYLRWVLGLESVEEPAEELDGLAFGGLAHRVLDGFGRGDRRDAADAGAVYSDLRDRLDTIVRDRYGSDPLAAVRVQVEQLRRRFEAFANWQADRTARGWRILHAELGIGKHAPASFDVDGQPFSLYGRIDRIDTHEATGEHVVFDYKTGDTPHPPDRTHRKGDGWVDLQLPLYRHLARHAGIDGMPSLGYITLPKDTMRVDAMVAEWDEPTLCGADDVAREVVRNIREENFYPPTAPPPPGFFGAFAAICQEGRLTELTRAEVGV